MDHRKQVDNGFVIDQEHLPGRCFVLTGSWTPRCKATMEAERAQFLRLNSALGAHYDDLGFLADLPFLKGVEIYGSAPRSFDPLLQLQGLELLGLQTKFPKIDFGARFPRLKFASFNWRPGCESIERCLDLEFLFVEGYPFTDLSALTVLQQLRRLHINSRALERANGVQSLQSLRHLTFAYCAMLSDINAVASCDFLEVLELHTCKQVATLVAVGALSKLRRLLVENCGAIDSIRPLLNCELLEELYLPGTKVSDGDLEPMLKLKKLRRVAFPKSRVHSHSMEEINSALAQRA